MKSWIWLLALYCAACGATPAGTTRASTAPPSSTPAGATSGVGSAVAASATASVEVRLDYVEMNGKRYRAIEDVGTAARSLPAGATVLVKSSLNGTTAQSRKLLDDRTASVVAVLQKAGVKHILIKQAITLRS